VTEAPSSIQEAPKVLLDLVLRAAATADLSAIRHLHALSFATLAAGERSLAQVGAHTAWARRGLASPLVRDAEERARAAGYPRMIVRANRNAVPLHRKLGYAPRREGVMSAPGGIDLPVVFMEKIRRTLTADSGLAVGASSL
jgi:GNAT superfamily N-acetyltransferase